jgi:hypothetical protein
MVLQEGLLGSVPRFLTLSLICALLLGTVAAQQQPSRMRLETSEALFSTMAALNACGYDQDLRDSLPLRAKVREEVVQSATSISAQNALERICKFYGDHRQADAARNLAQYVSLALYLGDGPAFTPKVPDPELPPDASYVLGFVPLLQNFYITTELHKIFQKHRPEYDQILQRYHKPVNDELLATDLYLRRPMSGYQQHEFILYIEPLIAPGQVNSRNYTDNYYMVLSPDTRFDIPVEQVRHTYLHYVLDPMTQQRLKTMQRLAPLLETVKQAPLEESFKSDVSLLLNESLIRAIEAHLLGGPKGVEDVRRDAVEAANKEGYILTPYFYDALSRFQKEEIGLKEAYPDWLFYIDVPREIKRAEATEFSKSASPELVRASRKKVSLTDLAERALSGGNPDAAAKFAQESLEKREDSGRALFILARAAALKGKPEEAKDYFEQTLQNTQDAHLVAWSHIYLARICDLQEDRDAAKQHYQAALDTKDAAPDTRTAAEKGLEKPYTTPSNKK